jgi:hypothetical protein
MGSITRGLSNNITTGGVILPAGITNASVSAVTSFANAPAGTLRLISTQTASSSATISFTTGLDSTYDAYEFHFINIRPDSDNVDFTFNLSTDSGSNYNVTKTTTSFRAFHDEGDVGGNVSYVAEDDLAQSTSFQLLTGAGGGSLMDSTSDEHLSGKLELFNPSSTTYVKHFIARTEYVAGGVGIIFSIDTFIAGYGNTTSAVNAIQFKMSSGNIADGIIKLYGVKKS